MSESAAGSARITVIDALRGFALAGIAVVHFGEQYLGYLPPPGHRTYSTPTPLDGLLEAFCWLFIRGKGFGLFSLLFGLSFALQMQRAERRDPGGDFRPRFVWRLAVLLAIGWFHGLVYSGDILTVYALLGLPLVLFYRVPDRWLFALALVLAIGTPRVAQRAFSGPTTAEERKAVQSRMDEVAIRHWDALKRGDVQEIARIHTTDAFRAKWEFQFGPMGRGWQTFALFLVGLWAGRHRVFAEAAARRAFWKRVCRWTGGLSLAIPVLALALFLVGQAMNGAARGGAAAATTASQPASPKASPAAPGQGSGQQAPNGGGAGEMPDLSAWPVVSGLCVFDTWNGVMTLFYASAFVLLFERPRWHALLRRFAPVGRMALSSYVTQSLLGSLVFFGIGLGLLGRFGNSVTLPIGGIVFLVQAVACAWWLQRFRFGPLEWLWRSLTWLRLEKLRLEPAAVQHGA